MSTISNIRISELEFDITSEQLAATFEEKGIAVVNKIALIPYMMDDVEGDVVLFMKAFIEIKERCDTETAYDIIYELNKRNSVNTLGMMIEKMTAPCICNPIFVTNFEEIYKIHDAKLEDDIEACYDSYSPAYSDVFSTSNEDDMSGDTVNAKHYLDTLEEGDLWSVLSNDSGIISQASFGYDINDYFSAANYYYNALDIMV